MHGEGVEKKGCGGCSRGVIIVVMLGVVVVFGWYTRGWMVVW